MENQAFTDRGSTQNSKLSISWALFFAILLLIIVRMSGVYGIPSYITVAFSVFSYLLSLQQTSYTLSLMTDVKTIEKLEIEKNIEIEKNKKLLSIFNKIFKYQNKTILVLVIFIPILVAIVVYNNNDILREYKVGNLNDILGMMTALYFTWSFILIQFQENLSQFRYKIILSEFIWFIILLLGVLCILQNAWDNSFTSSIQTKENIKDIQRYLYKIGYVDEDAIDGTSNTKTQNAIKDIFNKKPKLFSWTNSEDWENHIKELKLALKSEATTYPLLSQFSKEKDAVYRMRKMLNELGYIKTVNNRYDGEAITAVVQFQDDNKLQIDGQCGPETWWALLNINKIWIDSKIEKSYIKKGERSPIVISVKNFLIENGYMNISDKPNEFDDITEEAIKLFQKQNDLNPDGIIGPRTWLKMISLGYKR